MDHRHHRFGGRLRADDTSGHGTPRTPLHHGELSGSRPCACEGDEAEGSLCGEHYGRFLSAIRLTSAVPTGNPAIIECERHRYLAETLVGAPGTGRWEPRRPPGVHLAPPPPQERRPESTIETAVSDLLARCRQKVADVGSGWVSIALPCAAPQVRPWVTAAEKWPRPATSSEWPLNKCSCTPTTLARELVNPLHHRTGYLAFSHLTTESRFQSPFNTQREFSRM